MSDYQIVVDLWEGNPDFNFQEAKDNGVTGVILRLNDMNGGHHKDALFDELWERASIFELRTCYFVYNPWVKGYKNFNWFMVNRPSDMPMRVALDVEVRYPGYSASEYANQVTDCKRLFQQNGFNPTIYTGAGYLDLCSYWLKTVDYWWARYPDFMKPGDVQSWGALKAKLDMLQWQPDWYGTRRLSPATVKLWQVSDKWILSGRHGIDINIWNGDYASLAEWWGVTPTTPPTPAHWWDGMTTDERVLALCEMHPTKG